MSELITKETPEPEESLFFIDGTIFVITEDGGYGEPGYYGEPWEELRKENLGRTIESLSEHDARIRREALAHHDAEALRLTDRELDSAVNGFIAANIMDYPVEDCINYAMRNVRLLREGHVAHDQGKIDVEADHE